MHFLRRIKAAREALSAHNQAAELSRKNNQSYFQCAFRRLTVTHSIFFKNRTNVYLQVYIYFSVFWEEICSFFAKEIGKFFGIFFLMYVRQILLSKKMTNFL